MLYNIFSLLIVLTLASARHGFPFSEMAGHPDWMSTPVGFRPKKCVHTAKDNNHIIHLSDEGSTYEYPATGEKIFYPALPECIENAKVIEKYLSQKRARVSNAIKKPTIIKDAITEDKLGLLREWDVYGGWYTKPDFLGNFTVEYTLPNEDMVDNGQLLYYFIGAQNDEDTEVTIIQPVITYCPSGCNTRTAKVGWSGTSWNCCPAGQSHSGSVIGLSKGLSNVFGFAYSNPTEGNVDIYTEYNGASSDLHITGDKRQYNWVDVTLEEYNYAQCTSFNDMPFGFYNMTLVSTENSVLSNPKWTFRSGVCDGTITCDSTALNCDIVGNGRS